jgi:predicted nicotinamide N-methyase
LTHGRLGKHPPVIAGYPAELHSVDLRTFARRDDALGSAGAGLPGRTPDGLTTAHNAAAPGTMPAGARACIDLVCVAQLESIVDRDELLRAADPAEPPYWALPWIGARAIAARMIAEAPSASAHVLDLGCGLGLSGVAAGLAGSRVTFADNVAATLEFAHANARLHELAAYEALCLDFTRDRLERRFDWVLAADIVYDPACYAPLVDFLDAHLTEDGTLLLTESLRADARTVIEMLSVRGIRASTDAIWVVEDGKPERTWLHTLRRE